MTLSEEAVREVVSASHYSHSLDAEVLGLVADCVAAVLDPADAVDCIGADYGGTVRVARTAVYSPELVALAWAGLIEVVIGADGLRVRSVEALAQLVNLSVAKVRRLEAAAELDTNQKPA